MSVIEIVFAILLILSCVFIIAIVLMQESKQGMSNVISGGSADNYFQKNSGRTKEAKLSRATKVAAVIVFLAAIAVNLISVYWGGSTESGNNGTSIGTAGDIADLMNDGEITVASRPAEGKRQGETVFTVTLPLADAAGAEQAGEDFSKKSAYTGSPDSAAQDSAAQDSSARQAQGRTAALPPARDSQDEAPHDSKEQRTDS